MEAMAITASSLLDRSPVASPVARTRFLHCLAQVLVEMLPLDVLVTFSASFTWTSILALFSHCFLRIALSTILRHSVAMYQHESRSRPRALPSPRT
jgi:hypothetical protein